MILENLGVQSNYEEKEQSYSDDDIKTESLNLSSREMSERTHEKNILWSQIGKYSSTFFSSKQKLIIRLLNYEWHIISHFWNCLSDI